MKVCWRRRQVKALVAAGALTPSGAWAHVSEQGFVLLLPTGVYTSAGVAVVALTVLMLIALPSGRINDPPPPAPDQNPGVLRGLVSLAALTILSGLVWIGIEGPRDPLSNLMPLVVWTLWWVALVSVSGLVGDPWRWINPWTGLLWLLNWEAPWTLPRALGQWPAVALLMAFAGFLLADIAPDDPARLAWLIAGYGAATLGGALAFGRSWFAQVELFSVLFALFGDLAPMRWRDRRLGWPGWRLDTRQPTVSLGIFALALLGIGSFDGLNETFWWLGQIGINPLEFPGRSAVMAPTLAGLWIACLGLIAVFGLCVWLGATLAGGPFGPAFARLALTVLPIALGYHIAHYLTAFLVNIQYVVAALSDPLARGADWLGIEPFYVTTGFFNRIDTVRVIWLSQAGAVVLGHVWAVLLAHRYASDLFAKGRRAVLATAPLSVFMVGYTFLGLWLLAAPRGA